ncbi:MAG: three-Cys-motif partner protein TcmP [Kiritimatiellae bacterium]|nr:three-Cys-motif partner protein TcmP [Kiritimatiellia bacterium]
MSGRNHHRQPYDDGTKDKLELYRGYVKEWLPVFLYRPQTTVINIFDFFAGPGADLRGIPGSPAIAHEEVTNAIALKAAGEITSVAMYFNEFAAEKYAQLVSSLEKFPKTDHVSIKHERLDFSEALSKWYPLMQQPGAANLLFLDQNGVKHITENVFKQILRLPFTDLLFFISSSMVNRFKTEGSIIDRVPVSEADLSRMNGTNVHRIVVEAYRRLVPPRTQYFLAPFSIRKDSNVYGLIFGSHHPLGMDKFLRQCWKKDELRGEANFDIDGESINPAAPALFEEMNKPQKITFFESELSKTIMCRNVRTNKDAYVFALERGFLGKHAKKVITDLIAANKLPKQELHVSYGAWDKKETETIQYHGETTP